MKTLTQAQQSVIESCDGHNIVCSLPGSGKTATMVECAMGLLANSYHQLLLVTFTNAATEEMRHRLFEKLPQQERGRVRIVNFDKLFVSLYKAQQRQSQQRLCVGVEQWQLIDRAVQESGIRTGFGEMGDISQAIDKFSRQLEPKDDGSGDGRYFKVFETYRTLKQTFLKVDLNDLTAAVLVMTQTQTRQLAPLECSHILVDEFQDVSAQQLEWLVLQGLQGKKLIAFGDDDQSIYGWRGSCGYDAFVRLQETFGSAGHVLDTCFRCTREVLSAAAQLITHNKDRIDKRFISGAGSGGRVALFGRDGENRVPLTQDTFGVLARNNSLLKGLHEALQRRGIPAELGRERSVLDDPEVNTVFRVLHVIRYPMNTPFLGDVLLSLKVPLDQIKPILLSVAESGWFQLPLKGCPSAVKKLYGFSNNWRHTVRDQGSWKERQRQLAGIMPTASLKRSVDRVMNLMAASGDDFWQQAEIWLRRLTQIRNAQSVERAQVELRTFHSSKGLEYDRVIVTHLQENIIPGLDDSGDSELYHSQLEEARRLLFVAMTHAKHYLGMYCYGMGEDDAKGPSQFITQLAADGGYPLRELDGSAADSAALALQ
ncbi:UvrD-helicase domain-containing protein [Ferrimonas kyonanensis]|uniref:UvrD-helicase domain-containing protein n=1 Tax=Ferrimonas kyonanensis TaxID=364763 RepID=UPI000408CB75|nr:ATP-dependent helicase [Ferrimonas kyonanensis]